jgi:hypothetical protein
VNGYAKTPERLALPSKGRIAFDTNQAGAVARACGNKAGSAVMLKIGPRRSGFRVDQLLSAIEVLLAALLLVLLVAMIRVL